MESLNSRLSVIKKQFPSQTDRIEELYVADEDFRTLCSDYYLCMQQLQQFMKHISETKHTIEEYDNMRKELEKELADFIFHD